MMAYSYRRFSSGKQAHGSSIVRQTEQAEAYCKKHGLTLDTSLHLADEGKSAFRGDNSATGALAAFLRAIDAKEVSSGSKLIVESLDRLSRHDIDEAYDLFRRIIKGGVAIVTLNPEREYDQQSLKTIMGIIEPLVVMARANEESQMKSVRSADAWRRRRMSAKSRPVTSICPHWLRRDGDRFVPIPDRVAVVRRIFDLAVQGLGCRLIAKTLNQDGERGFGNSPYWSHITVQYLLKSRTVIGEFQPQRRSGSKRTKSGLQPIPDYYPRIIDERLFYQAQAKHTHTVRPGRRGNSVSNLFTGLLWSANENDGTPMMMHAAGTKPTKRKRYLISRAADRGEKGVKWVSLDYELFEYAFMIFATRLNLSLDAHRPGGIESEIAENKLTIDRLERDSAKLKKRIRDRGYEDIEVLADEVAEIERDLKGAIEQGKKLEAAKSVDPKGELQELRTLAQQNLDAANAGEHQSDVFRERLKTKIHSHISEIWVRINAPSKFRKEVLAQVFFRDGSYRWLSIDYENAPHRPPVKEYGDGSQRPSNLTLKRYKRK